MEGIYQHSLLVYTISSEHVQGDTSANGVGSNCTWYRLFCSSRASCSLLSMATRASSWVRISGRLWITAKWRPLQNVKNVL